mgnify:CR=1 FL=1
MCIRIIQSQRKYLLPVRHDGVVPKLVAGANADSKLV